MSDLHVQVVEGRSRQPSRTFTPGAPTGPFGVGSAGEWVVEGQGVGPIHAYLYFDGNTLLIATAPPHVTTVNGAPVGGDWSPVAVPGEVRLAGVRLSVHSGEVAFDDAATNAVPAEMDDVATAFIDRGSGAHVGLGASGHPGSPAAGRRPPPADESTAFMPIEQVRKGSDSGPMPGGPMPGGPMPGGPMPGGPMPGGPMPGGMPETIRKPVDPSKIALTIAPGQIPTPQIEPPPTPQQRPPAQNAAGGFWAQASLPRKIIYILLPVALITSAFALLGDDPKEKKKGSGKAASSASASAASSSSAPTLAAVGSAPALPTGPLLPFRPMPSATGPKKLPAPKVPPATLERKAVDAVIAGNYAEAIALYEQLGQQYPDVPAYKEAIRILKAKQSAPK